MKFKPIDNDELEHVVKWHLLVDEYMWRLEMLVGVSPQIVLRMSAKDGAIEKVPIDKSLAGILHIDGVQLFKQNGEFYIVGSSPLTTDRLVY